MSDGEINVDSIDGEVSTSANIVGQLYPQGEKGDKGDPGNDGFSPTVTTEKVGKTTTITITDAEGVHTATILDGADGQGSGDMRTEVYDVNQNGIVDNAEKVNNHTVNSDVPADAVFTDTTYTAGTGIDITNGVITNTQTSAEWGNITGTLSDQTDLKSALDDKADTSDVPTQTSDLINDSGFIDKDVNNLTNYDTSTTVDTKISNSEEVLIGSDSGIKASHEIWVDTNDVTPYINSEISNSYGTAENLGYSQEYVNDRFDGTKPMGDVVVDSIKSKNILDSKALNYGTISQSDGQSISSSTTVVYHLSYIPVKPNTKYTISYNGSSQITIRLFNYGANKSYIGTETQGGSGVTYKTFTTGNNVYYLRLQFGQEFLNEIQLEEGEVATEYRPYQNLDNPFAWRLAGTQTGTTSISIPLGISELNIMVTIAGNYVVKVPMHIPVLELGSSGRGFNAGYTQSSINVSAGTRVTASLTSVFLASAYLNGADVTSTTVISVYYR